MILTGVVLIVGGFAFSRTEGAAGLVFIAGGIFFGVRAVEPLHGGYADGRSLWILGADPAYLAALPELPGDRVPAALIEADKVL